MVYLTTYKEGRKTRLRPLDGQNYDSMVNVQGPREIRKDYPVGSIFTCGSLSDTGRGFYRSSRDVEHVSRPLDKLKTAKRVEILQRLKRDGVSITDKLLQDELDDEEINLWDEF